MDFWSPRSTGGFGTSTHHGFESIKSEVFDLVDPEMSVCLSDDQKPIVLSPRPDVYSDSDSFLSSGFSGTPSTTNSSTTMGVPRRSPFSLLNSILDGTMDGSVDSLSSSDYCSMDSTTTQYISPTAPSTSTKSPCTTSCYPYSSSSGNVTTLTTTTARPLTERNGDGRRKGQGLDHLSAEQKIMRRRAKNRLAAQASRKGRKTKLSDLELTVARLTSEKELLLAQLATLPQELQEMKSEFELVQLTPSLDETCPNCKHLHLQ